jgi:hypothetical protein
MLLSRTLLFKKPTKETKFSVFIKWTNIRLWIPFHLDVCRDFEDRFPGIYVITDFTTHHTFQLYKETKSVEVLNTSNQTNLLKGGFKYKANLDMFLLKLIATRKNLITKVLKKANNLNDLPGNNILNIL